MQLPLACQITYHGDHKLWRYHIIWVFIITYMKEVGSKTLHAYYPYTLHLIINSLAALVCLYFKIIFLSRE